MQTVQGADLVIVEFAVNDHVVGGDLGENLMNAPERRAFERMLRKLLDLPNRRGKGVVCLGRGPMSGGRLAGIGMGHAAQHSASEAASTNGTAQCRRGCAAQVNGR